jgi:hypothetical protein
LSTNNEGNDDMATLQLRRHQELVAQLAKESERRDNWIARLIRSDAKVQRLRRQIVRSSKRLADRPSMDVVAGINAAKAPPPVAPDTPAPELPADPIPTFLDRRNLMADPKTKDKNAERRAVEKEKRDAKLTGKLRRMPLTGRAALDAIRNG